MFKTTINAKKKVQPPFVFLGLERTREFIHHSCSSFYVQMLQVSNIVLGPSLDIHYIFPSA
eukprot:7448908-Karenia_brevis.AAC.1